MCGYVWVYVGMYGYVWVYMGMYWYVWIFMGMYGYIWVFMDSGVHLRGIVLFCHDCFFLLQSLLVMVGGPDLLLVGLEVTSNTSSPYVMNIKKVIA